MFDPIMASDKKKENVSSEKQSSSRKEIEDLFGSVETAAVVVLSIIDEPFIPVDSGINHTRNSSLSFNNQAISDSSLPIEKNFDDDDSEILDVIPVSVNKTLPCFGELIRKFLQVGSKVWLTRRNRTIPIVEAMVLGSLCDAKRGLIYEVKYKTKNTYLAICYATELAYKENCDVIVPIGTRVVALFEERMFAGVVAEHPTHTNSNRYLIFFDDDNNHAGYIEHKNIHVICDQSDAFKNFSDFFQTYLKNYPECPLVKFKKHQLTRTKYDKKWERTIVLDIDGSLVKMHFIDKDIIQWIYRGCERFELISDFVDRETEKARKYRRRVPFTYNMQLYVALTRCSETAVVYDSNKKRKGEFPNDGSSEDYAKNGLKGGLTKRRTKKRRTN